MDYGNISRKYLMGLIDKVDKKVWEEYSTYENVAYYIEKWHEDDEDYTSYNHWENFYVQYKDEERKRIDLKATLHKMPPDIVIRIAIELGIDTPGFLPAIPTFKNVLKDENENAYQAFDRALKNVFENPDEAISLANSTLEGAVKSILSDEVFKDLKYNSNDTLYDLTQTILKQYKLFPGKHQELTEVNQIGSGFLKVAKNIEALRSTKTKSHGKAKDDYIITDPLWAYFVVNTVSTIGLFLIQFFETKYKPALQQPVESAGDESIDLSEIPF